MSLIPKNWNNVKLKKWYVSPFTYIRNTIFIIFKRTIDLLCNITKNNKDQCNARFFSFFGEVIRESSAKSQLIG